MNTPLKIDYILTFFVGVFYGFIISLFIPIHVVHAEESFTFVDFDNIATGTESFVNFSGDTGLSNFSEVSDIYSLSPQNSYRLVSTSGIDQIQFELFGKVAGGIGSSTIGYITGNIRVNNNDSGLYIGTSRSSPVLLVPGGLSFGASGFCNASSDYSLYTFSPSVPIGSWLFMALYWNNSTGQIKIGVDDQITPWIDCFDPLTKQVGSVGMAGIGQEFFDDITVATDYEVSSQLVFLQTTEYINIIKPTYATTTATTSVDISVSFATPLSIDFRPATNRTITILDAVTKAVEYSTSTLLGANAGESLTKNFNLNLTQGSKIIKAGYYTTDGVLYSELAESFFNVVTNTYLLNTGLDNPREETSGLSQIDCGTFDVGCQFQKAIVFLFYPPEDSLSRFGNIWQTLRTKKPFGYVTQTIEQLKELNTTGTQAFDLGNIPFMDTIFTPFKTLLSGILWAVFAIYFYQRRLKHLDI